jgi:Ribonuclease 2-5A
MLLLLQWIHFKDVGKEVQEEYGLTLEAYFAYWTTRFPRLLIVIWKRLKDLDDLSLLQRFYGAG